MTSKVFLALYVLLFAAVTGMWLRGHWSRGGQALASPPAPGRSVVVDSVGVGVRTWAAAIPTTLANDPYVRRMSSSSGGSSSSSRERWFGLYEEREGHYFGGGTAYPYREIRVPYYVLWWACLPAVLIAGREVFFLRRRRAAARAGRCASCGYDLRATPDRCPECGRFAPPTPGKGLDGTRARVASNRRATTDARD